MRLSPPRALSIPSRPSACSHVLQCRSLLSLPVAPALSSPSPLAPSSNQAQAPSSSPAAHDVALTCQGPAPSSPSRALSSSPPADLFSPGAAEPNEAQNLRRRLHRMLPAGQVKHKRPTENLDLRMECTNLQALLHFQAIVDSISLHNYVRLLIFAGASNVCVANAIFVFSEVFTRKWISKYTTGSNAQIPVSFWQNAMNVTMTDRRVVNLRLNSITRFCKRKLVVIRNILGLYSRVQSIFVQAARSTTEILGIQDPPSVGELQPERESDTQILAAVGRTDGQGLGG